MDLCGCDVRWVGALETREPRAAQIVAVIVPVVRNAHIVVHVVPLVA
jgi:hypothetical protein